MLDWDDLRVLIRNGFCVFADEDIFHSAEAGFLGGRGNISRCYERLSTDNELLGTVVQHNICHEATGLPLSRWSKSTLLHELRNHWSNLNLRFFFYFEIHLAYRIL